MDKEILEKARVELSFCHFLPPVPPCHLNKVYVKSGADQNGAS